MPGRRDRGNHRNRIARRIFYGGHFDVHNPEPRPLTFIKLLARQQLERPKPRSDELPRLTVEEARAELERLFPTSPDP